MDGVLPEVVAASVFCTRIYHFLFKTQMHGFLQILYFWVHDADYVNLGLCGTLNASRAKFVHLQNAVKVD
jgi:hypothetical protein